MTGEQRLTVDTTIDKPLFLYIQAETEANVQSEYMKLLFMDHNSV